jgi:phosphohistidine phosphatase SixA
MRSFFLLAAMAIFASCSTTTIYMTRHAERQAPADGIVTSASDPDLTPAGRLRADALRDSLHNKHIAMAFATQYKRTFQTAEPTVIDQHIALHRYIADDSNQFIDSLIKVKNKNFLVVGHNTTVPVMLKHIGLNPGMEKIAEDDYSNLFVVTIKRGLGKKVTLVKKRYGKL